MTKFGNKLTALVLGGCLAISVGAAAQATPAVPATPNAERRNDRKDLRHDRRDVRHAGYIYSRIE